MVGGNRRKPAVYIGFVQHEGSLILLTPRRQQIFPGETLAGLSMPWFHPAELKQFDIVWFIDNEAAASCLIRGNSREQDVHAIAQFAHLLYHLLNCRVWIEWVDSHSNPSDGLSRLGLSDPWTIAQEWQLAEYIFPSNLLPSTFLNAFLDHRNLSDSG